MKKILILIAIIAVTSSTFAQFDPGPRAREATVLTPTELITVAASSATNLTTAGINNPFRVGKGGNVAFYAGVWSTNASTADVAFQFQISQDGRIWYTPPAPQLPALTLMKLGGTTITTQFTNAWASGALNNVNWLRLNVVSNGHTASLFLTNATFYQHGL